MFKTSKLCKSFIDCYTCYGTLYWFFHQNCRMGSIALWLAATCIILPFGFSAIVSSVIHKFLFVEPHVSFGHIVYGGSALHHCLPRTRPHSHKAQTSQHWESWLNSARRKLIVQCHWEMFHTVHITMSDTSTSNSHKFGSSQTRYTYLPLWNFVV